MADVHPTRPSGSAGPTTALRRGGVPLLVAALASGAVTATLGARLAAVLPAWTGRDGMQVETALRAARVEELVELPTLLVGALLGTWLTMSLATAAACASARAVGRQWSAGERFVARTAPAVVRRALVLTAGTGVAIAGAGLPAVAAGAPSVPDLGWSPTVTSAPWAPPQTDRRTGVPAGAGQASPAASSAGGVSDDQVTSSGPVTDGDPATSPPPGPTAGPAAPAGPAAGLPGPWERGGAGASAATPGPDGGTPDPRLGAPGASAVVAVPPAAPPGASSGAPPAWTEASATAVPGVTSAPASALRPPGETAPSRSSVGASLAGEPSQQPVGAPSQSSVGAASQPSTGAPPRTAASSVASSTAAPSPSAPPPTGGHGTPASASDPHPRPVTVLPGDTLWGIAAEHLPADASTADVAAAWPAWYAANAELIGADPGLILPGQVLQPPPDLSGPRPTTGARP